MIIDGPDYTHKYVGTDHEYHCMVGSLVKVTAVNWE
ncbi:hypothetical protein BBR47_28500 [Brevibacillus brevis NBRC 100599]|uniref:Uncharacterized protein n=1 Tax=Brevibacillus brevis (strain 47 / JCM 6285 / NBRC 100599) TaxID=358681 RepID=C0ZDG8_BREBN|nr:hypothetical protein BBR47_28500 [Brevibacillus brevis NBRC 100599]